MPRTVILSAGTDWGYGIIHAFENEDMNRKSAFLDLVTGFLALRWYCFNKNHLGDCRHKIYVVIDAGPSLGISMQYFIKMQEFLLVSFVPNVFIWKAVNKLSLENIVILVEKPALIDYATHREARFYVPVRSLHMRTRRFLEVSAIGITPTFTRDKFLLCRSAN